MHIHICAHVREISNDADTRPQQTCNCAHRFQVCAGNVRLRDVWWPYWPCQNGRVCHPQMGVSPHSGYPKPLRNLSKKSLSWMISGLPHWRDPRLEKQGHMCGQKNNHLGHADHGSSMVHLMQMRGFAALNHWLKPCCTVALWLIFWDFFAQSSHVRSFASLPFEAHKRESDDKPSAPSAAFACKSAQVQERCLRDDCLQEWLPTCAGWLYMLHI